MKERTIINQTCGIGDIFFCQKIKKKIELEGHEVIWPVEKEFFWISEYIDGNFPIKNNFKLLEKDKIIDLSTADALFPQLKIMQAKYKLVNIDYSDWQDFFIFKRKQDKENELFYKVLNLKDNEEYALISKNYGSPPNFLQFEIKEPENIKKIYLDFYDGFSLFDWCKVAEKAKEIHMVDSSLNYILEKIKSNIIYLYSRRPNNWSEIDFLFNKKYIRMN